MKPDHEIKCGPDQSQKLVVVLGMHRSGTSAIARGLEVLGVNLGDRLMPPAKNNNDKGFFEDIDVVALNEEILKVCGRSWHSIDPIQANEVDYLADRGYVSRALELLRKKLGQNKVFGFKDPRVSKLIAFWARVFTSGNFNVFYVLSLRNPLSVAKSLLRRDGFCESHSYFIWADSLLSSICNSRGAPLIVVDYDVLMGAPISELKRIAEWLGHSVDSDKFEEYRIEFLDEGLRHSHFSGTDIQVDVAAPSLVKELYASLVDVIAGKSSIEYLIEDGRLRRWISEVDRMRPLLRLVDNQHHLIQGSRQNVADCDGQIASLNRVLADRDGQITSLNHVVADRDGEIANLKHVVADRDGQIASLSQTLEEIRGSTSWRLSAFVRWAGSTVRALTGSTARLRKVAAAWAVLLRLLRTESLPSLVSRSLRVWRREGMRGILARLRQQHYMAAAHAAAGTPTALGFALVPAALVRDQDGRYALAPVSKGYTYIEPQRPADLAERLAGIAAAPRFSIVVPVYNTTPQLLADVLSSVQGQWYPHWELILADDASPSQETRAALAAINHPQIKLLRLEKNQGIAGATNAGLAAAQGDFIVFMDHDDVLTVDCLYELALCIEREQPDFVYSDEDKLDEQGNYVQPHFKPDWSPDTMMSTMFTCHVSCVRRSLLEQVGGLRSQYDGCQDWDFVLRVSEHTSRISHVPKVLYHWRIIPASVAADLSVKPYVLEASRRVRADALERRGLAGSVEAVVQVPGFFRVNYHLRGTPLISIIIPSRDNGEVLRRCIESIHQKSCYRHFEIIVLDNGSVQPATQAYLQQVQQAGQAQVIRHDAPFNFSELNNIGVGRAKGELLLFLNDDTEVLSADWLERMGGYAQLPHIGAVGVKLLYPGARQVQHAGVLNLADGPGHAFLRQPAETPGYYMRNLLEYNWLAVTGACLMMEADKYRKLGQFDESFPIAYNDIELCFRSVAAGLYNVVVPAVTLIHHESISRGVDHIDPAKLARLTQERRRLYETHPAYFQRDPFHNPNLHPSGLNFEVPC